MELRDLIVTPLLLLVVYTVAYMVRSRVTDPVTRVYFIPALTVRIIGALAVGFVYQFYYDGGDTFNYHTHGSRHIWEAFWDAPDKGLKLIFNDGATHDGVYKYSAGIRLFGDTKSYEIIRLAALFDLITFSSYSGTAVLFAVVSFFGAWLLFNTFYHEYPAVHRLVAVATLFVPSVVFWGSGILKDTVTLSSLGVLTFCVHRIFLRGRPTVLCLLGLFLSGYLIYTIKIYILLAFIPAVALWIFLTYYSRMRSAMLRLLVGPFVIAFSVIAGGWAMLKASEDNPLYSIDNIAETAKITAYDIRYYTGRDAGSGYSLGELDGSINSLVRLAPAAVVVTLFRPWLWEVNNVLMLISSLEATFFLVCTFYLLWRSGRRLWRSVVKPNTVFMLVFALIFSFAVGVSTYNFGTLVRYKIPMLPFFALALVIINYDANKERKVAVLDSTE